MNTEPRWKRYLRQYLIVAAVCFVWLVLAILLSQWPKTANLVPGIFWILSFIVPVIVLMVAMFRTLLHADDQTPVGRDQMDRETFERILTEEGIDDANLRADLWYSRPTNEIDEEELRKSAKKFKAKLPELLVRQALNRAMDREFGREQ